MNCLSLKKHFHILKTRNTSVDGGDNCNIIGRLIKSRIHSQSQPKQDTSRGRSTSGSTCSSCHLPARLSNRLGFS